MSYVTPREYRETAELIAADYASLKAELLSLYPNQTALTKTIVELSDDNSDGLSHDLTVDPPGSIAADLGKSFSDYGEQFATSEAKKIAAGYFRKAITGLNNHIVRRTSSDVTKLSDYIDTYDINTSYDMSLFSTDGVTAESSYYFSSDFIELATELGFVSHIPDNVRA